MISEHSNTESQKNLNSFWSINILNKNENNDSKNGFVDLFFKKRPNAITTTKYTLLTWIPKSLLGQFRRVANLYFVLISILMIIGQYAPYLYQTPLSPWSTVLTLLFVLAVTTIKEGLEDLQRSKSDKFENTKKVCIVTFNDNGVATENIIESQFVKPGDIIKLNGQVAVPADLVLIYTSMFSDGNKCYVETANIDGETNLKVKEAPSLLYDGFADVLSSGNPTKDLFSGSVSFQPPNKNIHRFIGTLKLDKMEEAIPISIENVLLRSSIFSNTDWGYGIAVYTGQETKIQMNNRDPPSKLSKLESNLNLAILMIFIAQCLLVTASVVSIYALGFQNYNTKLPYVYPDNQGTGSVLPLWLEQWIVFFLLYNNFIPISLYVTIELVNVGQAYLIGSDELLYRKELDVACQVRASNLVQELGQVRNIFSDKTGTLTRNEMKLVKFVLNGKIYDVTYGKNGEMSDLDAEFGSNASTLRDFCRCLITCHTVVREKTGVYRAESPDELALVEGVADYGCALKERGTKEMNVTVCGESKIYEIIAINAFNADRKRMSILIKDANADDYLVICKGADNIMLPLCSIEPVSLPSINESLFDLANMGLRTLVIAQKKLSASQAQEWLKEYKAAGLSTVNRDEALAAAGSKLENDLSLVGITAIEDRLQDEVPEVIADLAKAGIILWMLTGDKVETAINIGRSCNLILVDTILVKMTGIDTPELFLNTLKEEHAKVINSDDDDSIALVIDGPSFSNFDDGDKEQRSMLLKIGQRCRSVIACRLTPTQKKEIVSLVKTDTVPKTTTLSIGDGANDVSMILEGDVGIGIFGKEGRQAANNADLAIGEFKFLKRLLLVHGRWNYIRQSIVFLYSMHKNMVITLTLFWYSYFDAVSGTSPYESWIYTSYNLVLGLPIIFFGILDRDISADFALANPKVYSTGLDNVYLNVPSICLWIWNAILYAVVICLLFYLAGYPSFKDQYIYVTGTIVYTGLCNAMQGKVMFFHHQWAYPQICSMIISVVGMLLYYLLVSASTDDYYGVGEQTLSLPIFWFYGMFSVPFFAVLIDPIGYYLYMFFWPTKEIIYRELEHRELFTNPFQRATCLREGYQKLPPRETEVSNVSNNV